VSIYDIEDAKEDKATVPIYYESRLAKLDINREEIDRLNKDVGGGDRGRGGCFCKGIGEVKVGAADRSDGTRRKAGRSSSRNA